MLPRAERPGPGARCPLRQKDVYLRSKREAKSSDAASPCYQASTNEKRPLPDKRLQVFSESDTGLVVQAACGGAL